MPICIETEEVAMELGAPEVHLFLSDLAQALKVSADFVPSTVLMTLTGYTMRNRRKLTLK
jgi:hypothetical protein